MLAQEDWEKLLSGEPRAKVEISSLIGVTVGDL